MKHLFISLFLFISFTVVCQKPVSYQQISKEAYLDYVDKGYPANQWPQYRSQYIEDYKKRTYNTMHGGGEFQRKRTFKTGTMTNGAGQMTGSYSNGQILNSMSQPVGYINQGYVYSQRGLNSTCVGYVGSGQIKNCQGHIIYTIRGSSINNSQGYTVAYLKGDRLYNSSNQLLVEIAGLNMNSLAGYLLLLAR
jgi:hypothetical protein